jgi:hypothetical protein
MSEAKRRSPEEKLAELNKKMEQLKAQKQRVQALLNQKERKERTRRLIQMGAIFEKYFNLQSLEDAEIMAKQLLQLAQKNE